MTTSTELSLEDTRVVDVDSHVDERMDDLLPFIANDAIRRRITDASDVKREIFSKTRPTPPFPTTISVDNENTDLAGGDLVHTRGADPATKREYMDEFFIDYALLTPQRFGLASVNHDQIAVAIADAYNEWVMSEYVPHLDRDRVSGSVLIANHRPHRAAEVIDEWSAESFFRAVQLPASGLVPPAGHHYYDPIYEAAEAHGLPVLLHSGSAPATAAFPVQRSWAQNFVESHNLIFPFETMWHLNSIMFRGVPERYPGVKWVFIESGVEWVPWMQWRMDDHYLQNSQDIPILQKLPSEYIEDQCFFTTMPVGYTQHQHYLATIMEAAGADTNIMFASDHPHPDFDVPEEVFTPLSRNSGPETVRNVMGNTAQELFGF